MGLFMFLLFVDGFILENVEIKVMFVVVDDDEEEFWDLGDLYCIVGIFWWGMNIVVGV